MSLNAQKYRALLNSGEFIVSPGVYDGYSVRLVEAAGFKTAATSGAAVLGSSLKPRPRSLAEKRIARMMRTGSSR